jgi:lactate permease
MIALHLQVSAASAITQGAVFNWTPFVGGTAILVSWLIVALLLRVNGSQLVEIWNKTWQQMWGALLVGVFIFGLD